MPWTVDRKKKTARHESGAEVRFSIAKGYKAPPRGSVMVVTADHKLWLAAPVGDVPVDLMMAAAEAWRNN